MTQQGQVTDLTLSGPNLPMNFCFRILALLLLVSFADAEDFRIATFKADVTPPVGHMLLTGHFVTAEAIETPLEARGFILSGSESEPIVVCAVDWSEIRSDTYDLWRDRLATAAGTTRERVLLSAIHQHDTPMGDLGADRILRELGSPHRVITEEFHEKALSRVVEAASAGLAKATPVTHMEIGKGKVQKLASNRRWVDEEGKVRFDRGSACKVLAAQRAGEGAIDPFVHSLSFWNGEELRATYSVYATHPMSYYGTRKVNADFPGLARAKRDTETPGALQIYASGCSGNVTAGKYNSGNPENRGVLADRLHDGMKLAAKGERKPLRSITFQNETLKLDPRTSKEFSREHLESVIREKEDARSHLMASLGLSWLERVEKTGNGFDVPAVSFNDGDAVILLLPGEIYVDYQLFAQEIVGDRFVMTPGYGDSAAGYLPTEKHWEEGDSNLKGWCWIDKGMEPRVKAVIRKLLKGAE